MELVISLGLVGILMVAFVSGNVFVQKVVGNWSKGNQLDEEGEWVLSQLTNRVEGCDSLRIDSVNAKWRFYAGSEKILVILENGHLTENGKDMHQKNFTIKRLAISRIPFPKESDDSILSVNKISGNSSLYEINLEVQYRGNSHEFRSVVRNQKEFINQTI